MLLSLALPPPDPGFEFLLSSQGMSQGLQLTEGIQVFPRAYVAFGSTQVGVQWRNVSSPAANGVAAFFVRHSRTAGRVQLDFFARYRIRTGTRGGHDLASWEFSASARKRLGTMDVQASAEFSPDDFGGGRSLFVELAPAWSLGKATRISGGVGHRYRRGGPEYTAVNLGLSQRIDPSLTIDARYYRTDQGDAGPRYRGRLVVSARLAI